MVDAAQVKGKMKHIPLEDIIVENRFREDLGNIEELMEAIREKGVIQPISVDSNMRLLAGGRRYESSKRLGLKTIPALIREHIDVLDSREIELMENVHRKDFTWMERAKLTLAIDQLQKEKNPDWSQNATARLLDVGKAGVSRDIKLANAIEVIPELAECKTADDALKFLKKMEEEVITNELSKRQRDRNDVPATQGQSQSSLDRGLRDMYKRADANYTIKDCFDGMASLRAGGMVHFIECDPPYGIDLNNQKGSKDSIGSTVDGYKEVPADDYEAFLDKLTTDLFRVANKDCWMVFWYGPTWHSQVLSALRKAGWLVDDIPGIWAKGSGQTLQPELYLARTYEPFFIARKGNPVLVKRGHANVFNIIPTPASMKYHPTERPVHLIKELLRVFTLPNHIVFVPFLGSGATLRACYGEGMAGFGFDLDGKYKDKFLLAVEEDAKKEMQYSEQITKISSTTKNKDIPF